MADGIAEFGLAPRGRQASGEWTPHRIGCVPGPGSQVFARRARQSVGAGEQRQPNPTAANEKAGPPMVTIRPSGRSVGSV